MTRLFLCLVAATLFSMSALAEPPPAAVLLLDNRSVLQGEIERRGDEYLVRRDGGETTVPAARVLAALPNTDAAFRFLKEKIDSQDTDAHLRLARWCEANDLRTQAAAEAKLAAELAPANAIIQTTYQRLQRKADAPPPPGAPAKLPVSIIEAADAAAPIECGAEAFKLFATKVQPVLMNACIACHTAESAGKFRLEKTYPDALNSRPATQHNLSVALAMIDRVKPAASPLLQRAVAAHGGAALPPLRDRGVAPFKLLDEWVKLAMSDGSPPPSPPAPTKEIVGPIATVSDPKSDFGADKAKTDAPSAPLDPLDPAVFNRKHHPAGPKAGQNEPR
jgi:hypothetical protein